MRKKPVIRDWWQISKPVPDGSADGKLEGTSFNMGWAELLVGLSPEQSGNKLGSLTLTFSGQNPDEISSMVHHDGLVAILRKTSLLFISNPSICNFVSL